MRTASQVAARAAAREKKARAAEQRRLDRQAEQAALGAFEVALERGDHTAMAGAVTELAELGNSVEDVAALTNQDVAEIRRLRTLASPQRNH
jgi:hypothetical protein